MRSVASTVIITALLAASGSVAFAQDQSPPADLPKNAANPPIDRPGATANPPMQSSRPMDPVREQQSEKLRGNTQAGEGGR